MYQKIHSKDNNILFICKKGDKKPLLKTSVRRIGAKTVERIMKKGQKKKSSYRENCKLKIEREEGMDRNKAGENRTECNGFEKQ